MKPSDTQVLYLNKWVSRENFRTYVYRKGKQMLVNSYDEYQKAISSGTWFSTKEEKGGHNAATKSKRKSVC